ncbi:hypothetical protein AMECASPLE_038413 [Ameca splendens]|uniref:Uncharacterized protein n=1 Tax=Ameca splendens TaxID=208324 RepID=A0ABV0Y886_9TELE
MAGSQHPTWFVSNYEQYFLLHSAEIDFFFSPFLQSTDLWSAQLIAVLPTYCSIQAVDLCCSSRVNMGLLAAFVVNVLTGILFYNLSLL